MLLSIFTFVSFLVLPLINGQISTATHGGYVGYNLSANQDPRDPGAVVYATNSTPPPTNVSTTYPEPDVFLNASVYVGEINILVANLTAKINLDASVLSLLKFNAGVDLSIDRVDLLIQNISAEVTLEARLENLVIMIDDILQSLDLNPVLITLGQALTNVTGTAIGALTGPAPNSNPKRSIENYDIIHNILFSKNDYSGHTHTNQVLKQNGDIADQALNDIGDVLAETVVGHYLTDMTYNGDTQKVTLNGAQVQLLEYVYRPFPGLEVVIGVYTDASGKVIKTQVFSEASGGGSSTIGDN